MRKHFTDHIEAYAAQHDDLIFITGDLGYNALEDLRQQMGTRFINAGVAEQAMVSMAAGMASQGFRVICYSIAPFIVFRCLEQIRIDICLHKLPVYLVGNGGGYGYGIMGSTHHALEDLACMSAMSNMTCYVPAFTTDLGTSLTQMLDGRSPAYLRLGLGKPCPADFVQSTNMCYCTAPDPELTIIAQGPVANNILTSQSYQDQKDSIDLFIINQLPLTTIPSELKVSIASTGKILVVEEHVAIGGLGSALALATMKAGLLVQQFIHLCAQGYPGGLYGSQSYHQTQSGLDADSIGTAINHYF